MASLPASIKRIGSKATKKKWRHHFPHYKFGGFLLPWTPEFWSNLPLNIMQPFPTPSDAKHKIWSRLANWPLRYSSSKVWNFCHSRASKVLQSDVWSSPKSNSSQLFCLFWLPTTLMMIRSKMNELAWKRHFPIISLWLFRRSRAANSVVSGPIWPKFELVRDFMHVLVTCKYKQDWVKTNWERVET